MNKSWIQTLPTVPRFIQISFQKFSDTYKTKVFWQSASWLWQMLTHTDKSIMIVTMLMRRESAWRPKSRTNDMLIRTKRLEYNRNLRDPNWVGIYITDGEPCSSSFSALRSLSDLSSPSGGRSSGVLWSSASASLSSQDSEGWNRKNYMLIFHISNEVTVRMCKWGWVVRNFFIAKKMK